MSLKNLCVLESDVGSYSAAPQPHTQAPDFRAQIFSGALFDELCLPFLAELLHGPLEPEPILNDDYEIALVQRRNRKRMEGSAMQASSAMDGIYFLPITLRQLLDRVRQELTQPRLLERSMIARFGDVRVNLLTLETTRSDEPVVLTAREFKLLRYFINTPERVFSRNELLNDVWGYKNYPSTRTVDNHVCMLRQKLEPIPSHPVHFLTVHGMGYKFVP